MEYLKAEHSLNEKSHFYVKYVEIFLFLCVNVQYRVFEGLHTCMLKQHLGLNSHTLLFT